MHVRSVRPILLELYEKYYLPLGSRLNPALSGLLVALLPGLEEENSEFYPRVLNLLRAIAQVCEL